MNAVLPICLKQNKKKRNGAARTLFCDIISSFRANLIYYNTGGREMSTNEEIVIQIQNGHSELMTELWKRTYKLLIMLVMRVYRPNAERLRAAGAELDDYTQESYFALLDAVKAYKPDGEYLFNSYLNFHVKNRLRTLLGRQSDAAHRSVSLDEPVSGEEDELTLAGTITDESINIEVEITENDYIKQLHNDLEYCLQCLQPIERDTITAHYYNSLSIQAIAAAHNITVPEAANACKTGIEKLRRGRSRQRLNTYRRDIISQHGFVSGLETWKRTGSSSTEYAALKIIERSEKDREELR